MSDNLRRYRAIRAALIQGYPGQPTGTIARHLTTLAALISGIVGSKSTQLPNIAAHVPDGTQPESRVKRFAQVAQERPCHRGGIFCPVCRGLVDASGLADAGPGDGWQCRGARLCRPDAPCGLQRSRPAGGVAGASRARRATFLRISISRWLTQVHELIPAGARVVLLGDGAFDGTRLQHTMQAYRWSYVVRTGSHITVVWDGERFRCDTVGVLYQAGDPRRVEGCARDGRGLWADSAPLLLGKRV